MLTKFYDTRLPKWLKILCVIFGEAYVVYRVLLFVDSCIEGGPKKVQPLVVAILECVLWPFMIVCFIIDLVDTCHNRKIHWLCNTEEESPKEDPNPTASRATSASTEGATEVEVKDVK